MMKFARLLNLFLALVLILGTAPTAHTTEPSDTPDSTHVASPPLVGGAGKEAVELPSSDYMISKPIASPKDSFDVLGTSSTSAVTQSSTGNWQIECVYCPRRFGQMNDRSLQLDNKGYPHIAYGGNHLYYAWYDGAQWHYETVDRESAENVSLALSEAGHPHISYYTRHPDSIYASGGLKHAWHDGTTWHIETLDSEGEIDDLSLALDSLDRPHISYIRHKLFTYPNYYLKYAWHDGVSWRIEIVDEGRGGVSLALDSLDRPHIGYRSSDGYVKHTWHDGVSWQIETVERLVDFWGGPISLALDEVDRPHISYSNGHGHYGLRYAWYDREGWQIETVDAYACEAPFSLVLDHSGLPHISYLGDYDDVGYHLRYAWHDGIAWHSGAVTETTGWIGSSLAVDVLGRPHISYRSGGHIKHTWHDGTRWWIETVDSEERKEGDSASLALDGAGWPHISFRDTVNLDLKYARRTAMGWRVETVDSDADLGEYTSLALDESGQSHISYYDMSNGDLKHAWHTEVGWQVETVDSEGDVGKHTALALDESGQPHISYYDVSNGDLKYAWRDGMDWRIETVDSGGDVGEYTSLALDGAGRPHISYYDATAYSLRYAWHDGIDWQIETVDNGGWAGMFTSLALDERERPHISYCSLVGSYFGLECSRLGYAWRDGMDWRIEIVGSGEIVGECTSLALDGAERPHISYDSDGYLEYAWHNGTSWQIEAVDRHHWIAPKSLTLDGADRPHIGYSKADYLKYAWKPGLLDIRASSGVRLYPNDTLSYTLTLFGPGLSVRLWDPLPDAVRYVPGSITGTVTPLAVYNPTLQAVVWQGILPNDTAQEIHFQVTTDVAGTGSSLVPIINTAWITDVESGVVVSATAIVNVSFPPLSLDQHATPDGSQGNEVLTYTLTLSGPGLSVRLWDPLPPMVHYIESSITGTVTPTAVYSSTTHAVRWQGALPTDTIQTVRFQVTAGITGTGSLSLSRAIVNTAWLTDTESEWGVSATAIVNGRHSYLPLVLK